MCEGESNSRKSFYPKADDLTLLSVPGLVGKGGGGRSHYFVKDKVIHRGASLQGPYVFTLFFRRLVGRKKVCCERV